jgi:hypothetical protein
MRLPRGATTIEYSDLVAKLRADLIARNDRRLFIEGLPMGKTRCTGCRVVMDKHQRRGGGYHTHCFNCTVPWIPDETKQEHLSRVLAHYRQPEPRPKTQRRRKTGNAKTMWREQNAGQVTIRDARVT